jgi:hypothetical protein
MPDITALTAQVAQDETDAQNAQAAADAANAKLATDKETLNNATFINGIEALEHDPALLADVQSALAADGSKVTITVAP